MDLVFIIDKSGSLNFYGWEQIQNASTALVASLAVAPSSTRVAAITFGNDAQVEFRFGDYQTGPEVVSAIKRIVFTGGSTNLNGALQLLWSDVNGGSRPDAAKIALILTDGEDTENTDQTLSNAQKCKDVGYRLIAVGVTNRINSDRLLQIVSSPADFYTTDRFSELTSLLKTIGGTLVCSPTTPL